MSLAQPSLQERRPSPNVPLNLSSNNPFRQRAPSPSKARSTSPTRSPPTNTNGLRLVSTNPFLDNYQPVPEYTIAPQTTPSPPKPMPTQPVSKREPAVQVRTADLLSGLSLNEQPASDRNIQSTRQIPRKVPVDTVSRRPVRPENEEGRARRSQDEVRRARREKETRDLVKMDGALVTRSPEKRENRKPIARRNSDTSIMDVLDQERKSKSSEQQSKDGKSRDPRSREGRSGRPGKPSRRVDLIDKLDVTGIYGGATFHHDGPFDACNPHRNRKGARAAPMHAFAEGSANNALGGSGPVNKGIDFDQFHGIGAQGFTDYNHSSYGTAADPYVGFRGADISRRDPAIIDPKARTQYVVGNESAGLGTSTFLEGTPVSRSALQRQENIENETLPNAGGLQRKKSLAQKIRGMSRPRPGGEHQGAPPPGSLGLLSAPSEQRSVLSIHGNQYIDGYTGGTYTEPPATSPKFVQSAGGRAKMYEKNPFFSDLAGEKTAPTVESAKVPHSDQEALVTVTRSRTKSSPQQSGEGRPAIENAPTDGIDGKAAGLGSGFLSRVKSLKGGKRVRPERSGSASQAA